MEVLLRCGKCHVEKVASDFYFRKGKPDTSWCKACYREWHRQRYAPKSGADDAPRNCEQCGASYRPAARRPSAYCSRQCKDHAVTERDVRARQDAKPERQCLHCARTLPKSARSDAIFCSKKCNYGAHALQRKLRMRTGQDGKPGYLRAKICVRDKWRCGICSERVNPTLEHPHPRCASLDHVVPVCEGGGNEPANLRLVHLVCNLRRRHLGGGEQLAAF